MSFRRCLCSVPSSLGLAAICFVCAPGDASTITYGDLHGSNVSYLNVRESSLTDPGVTLFGAPSLHGDTLSFLPLGFGAVGMGGTIDLTDGQLSTAITAKPGYWITDISIGEWGAFTLAGTGTASTQTWVNLLAFVRVTEVDELPLIAPVVASFAAGDFHPIASSPGKFTLPEHEGVGRLWHGAAQFDVAAFLSSEGISGNATKLDLVFSNTLLAASEHQTAALISKQVVDISVATVPEPSTLVLLGMPALMALSRMRRRQRRR